MSASLVRKGLELFSEDLSAEPGQKKTQAGQRKTTASKKAVVKQKSVAPKKSSHSELTVKGRKVKSSLVGRRPQDPAAATEAAVHYLQQLSSRKTDRRVAEKLAEYQRRRSAKPKKPEQQKREPKSCFSEADFEKFEREHFVGQKKKLPPRADNL